MNHRISLPLFALAMPALGLAATTAAPVSVDSTAPTCSTIEWNQAFLKEFPKAAAACRGVTVKYGAKFAQFNGKVSKVGTNFVQVEVSDVANTPIYTIAFQVGVGGRITLDNRVVKVSDLKMGDQLTFWVHEGQFGISPTLTDAPMAIVKPEVASAN